MGCDGVAGSSTVIDECGVCWGSGSCFHLSSKEWIGVSLAVIGNILISVSLNAQKHAHNKNEALGANKLPYHPYAFFCFICQYLKYLFLLVSVMLSCPYGGSAQPSWLLVKWETSLRKLSISFTCI